MTSQNHCDCGTRVLEPDSQVKQADHPVHVSFPTNSEKTPGRERRFEQSMRIDGGALHRKFSLPKYHIVPRIVGTIIPARDDSVVSNRTSWTSTDITWFPRFWWNVIPLDTPLLLVLNVARIRPTYPHPVRAALRNRASHDKFSDRSRFVSKLLHSWSIFVL